jgi:hypothetical protein
MRFMLRLAAHAVRLRVVTPRAAGRACAVDRNPSQGYAAHTRPGAGAGPTRRRTPGHKPRRRASRFELFAARRPGVPLHTLYLGSADQNYDQKRQASEKPPPPRRCEPVRLHTRLSGNCFGCSTILGSPQ